MKDQTDRYTVTVVVAAPGTPLAGGGTSLPGHMFYVLQRGNEKPESFGFAPVTSGDTYGPGRVTREDARDYLNPKYARTMEITREQYETMKSFGNHPERFGFSNHFDLANKCVDFTWQALNEAGLQREHPAKVIRGMVVPAHPHDGAEALRPTHNIEAIRSIRPPFPGSELNGEKTNPWPERTPLQWLLSDQEHRANPIYQQAYAQVQEINQSHHLGPQPTDRNLAGSLAVLALEQGWDRIDRAAVGRDGHSVHIMKGDIRGLDGNDRHVAGMPMSQALATTLEASTERANVLLAQVRVQPDVPALQPAVQPEVEQQKARAMV